MTAWSRPGAFEIPAEQYAAIKQARNAWRSGSGHRVGSPEDWYILQPGPEAVLSIRDWSEVLADTVVSLHRDELPEGTERFEVAVSMMDVLMRSDEVEGAGTAYLEERYGEGTVVSVSHSPDINGWLVTVVPETGQDEIVGSWEPGEVSDTDVTEYLL